MDPDSVTGVERVPHGSSDDPDVLDFSANINTCVPEGARAAYDTAFAESRSYPPDDYPDFRAAAAAYVGCSPDHVVPTAGGLAALRLAIATTITSGDSALVPFPSFGEYAREIELQGGDPALVPHDELLDSDPASHALAVVCNPNNPTGESYDPDHLQRFADRCRENDTLLLVDEAFLGFTDKPSLAGEPGVVVARSLTKLFGFPGLRAGFAVAPGTAYDRLATARRSWSLGWPAARVGTVSMRDEAFVRETRERVTRERAFLERALATTFDVAPSDAPFLLVKMPDHDRLIEQAREVGVVVRDATTFRGLDSHIRVAVRERNENERLLAALGVDVPE